jgi:hypothetical protein
VTQNLRRLRVVGPVAHGEAQDLAGGMWVASVAGMMAAALTAPTSTRLFPWPTTRIAVQSGRGLFREGVSELFRQGGFEARGYANQADLFSADNRTALALIAVVRAFPFVHVAFDVGRADAVACHELVSFAETVRAASPRGRKIPMTNARFGLLLGVAGPQQFASFDATTDLDGLLTGPPARNGETR